MTSNTRVLRNGKSALAEKTDEGKWRVIIFDHDDKSLVSVLDIMESNDIDDLEAVAQYAGDVYGGETIFIRTNIAPNGDCEYTLPENLSFGEAIVAAFRTKTTPLPRTLDGRVTLDRYVSSDRLPHVPAQRLELNYMGVLSLLGRVAKELPRNHPERLSIERAYIDANVLMLQLKKSVYFEHASDGGYAMFERPAEPGFGRNPAPKK